MPRAEVGSTKHLANKMKSKGLQRLRWYCQVCEKQCRDSNGFKCHVQSESHVRQMQVVGEDPRKFIEQFSKDFHHDFVSLLRTAHGEKFVNANRFYQEYISNKEHIHMNATKWPSLTEYVKYLGREGICHVKEDEKDGLMIAWRDVSPEAVRRREAIRQAEQHDNENQTHEERRLQKMVKRAKQEAEAKASEAKALEEAKAKEPTLNETSSTEDASTKGSTSNSADAVQPETAPVKMSFGLKAKTMPNARGGLGEMKKQSIFKRQRVENSDGNTAKKLKV